MFRAIVFISFFICSAYSATTDIKPSPINPINPSVTDIKQPPPPVPPVKATVTNTLWTDIGLKEPTALIKVEYKNNGKVTAVTPGATVEKIITGPAPKLFWQLEKNAKYTMAMIDPDAPSRKEPTKRSWLHWLAVNLDKNTIPHDNTLAHYNGPTPPKGSGHHRYIFLVFQQTKDFDSKVQNEIRNKYKDNASVRGGFNVKEFAQQHGLGDAVAFNYFETETK
ncbi:hypothetical protein HA402_008347 [Bradysia odoriphaga]|nr:hypothetical protein HA402_008347 [Bradysia odoriphaga]